MALLRGSGGFELCGQGNKHGYFPDGDICSAIMNISLQNYGKAIIMRLVKNAEYFTES